MKTLKQRTVLAAVLLLAALTLTGCQSTKTPEGMTDTSAEAPIVDRLLPKESPEWISCTDPLSSFSIESVLSVDEIDTFMDMMQKCRYVEISREEERERTAGINMSGNVWFVRFPDGKNFILNSQAGCLTVDADSDDATCYRIDGFDKEVFDALASS
ncbi:MAG: hypothetical protein ACI3XR_02830 [Eubacteriales bacterium]